LGTPENNNPATEKVIKPEIPVAESKTGTNFLDRFYLQGSQDGRITVLSL
jgi:hypothetical protein